jgi:hypothetical protein
MMDSLKFIMNSNQQLKSNILKSATNSIKVSERTSYLTH